MVPLASADAGVTMISKSRTIGLLLMMAVLTGGAVWGVHALIASAGGAGSDYRLDTNGNGKVQGAPGGAQGPPPQARNMGGSARRLRSSPPPPRPCGGVPPSPPAL